MDADPHILSGHSFRLHDNQKANEVDLDAFCTDADYPCDHGLSKERFLHQKTKEGVRRVPKSNLDRPRHSRREETICDS